MAEILQQYLHEWLNFMVNVAKYKPEIARDFPY